MTAVIAKSLYLGCTLSFIVVIGLMVLRGRTSRAGAAIIFCCSLSAIWAGANAFPEALPAAVPPALAGLRLAAWLLLIVALIGLRGLPFGRYYALGAVALAAATVGYDIYLLALDPYTPGPHPIRQLLRITITVAGLLAIENLWRNTEAERHSHVWPLCLAIGGIFAYDLAVFADAFLNHSAVDISLACGQAMVGIFVAPLLILAMARNREWRVDVHVSRQVVLHTATLLASGFFLVAVGFAGVLVRGLGEGWGPLLQLAMLIGSMFVLAVVVSSESPRRRLKRFVSRNFFSHRYDYRAEWLKFIDLVSDPQHIDQLQVRILRALAEFVDSPSGVLWSLTRDIGYSPTAAWRQPLEAHQPKIPLDDEFILAFRGGSWVQERDAAEPDQHWRFASAAAWLAVPLAHNGDLVGFLLLDRPAHNVKLDWEAFNLLRATGRQAASYLAEEQSTKALLDAELLNNYHKRFAFVVHDIKNLASQLGLTVANARHYIEDPEFQQDMLDTIEDAVERMNAMLSRLKADRAPPQLAPSLDPWAVICDVKAKFIGAEIILEDRIEPEECTVAIDAEQLRSALTHLIQNAIDASPAGEPVNVRAQCVGSKLIIDVVDHGIGMDAKFIRDELFMPFRSTKSGGYGIGAYQTRELIRMSGGDLDVVSTKGAGTTMRVILPLTASRETAASSAAA